MALTKRDSNGVHFALNYGWGQGIDTAPLGGATLAIQGDAARSDPVDLQRDKGPNQLDITHTFNGSIVAISTVKRFDPWINKILSDNQICHPARQQRPARRNRGQPRSESRRQ